MSRPELPRLHVVTDDEILRRPDFIPLARELLLAGGPGLALHLRGPHTDGGTLFGYARVLKLFSLSAGSLLLVNDRVDVALAAGLQGVHLGSRSLSPAVARPLLPAKTLVGLSVHAPAQAAGACGLESGPDYVFLGSIYATASHPGVEGLGPEAVSRAAESLAHAAEGDAPAGTGAKPLVAIGGVTVERTPDLVARGAYGVAVLRGVWDDPHPLDAAMRYLQALSTDSEDS